MSSSAQPEVTTPLADPATSQDASLPVFNAAEQAAPGAQMVRVEDDARSISAFASATNYETAKKMATALSQSGMVPAAYQGKVANCLVAMELAGRTGASVFAIMQNLHIIQGKPSFSSAFLIATVNASGRFTPLRFETKGEVSKTGWACRAVAKDKASGDTLEGVWVSWEMAQAEGWTTKAGSKWKTMPELMIRYRAAAFWARIYAPEISLGMHTSDEMDDFAGPVGPTPGSVDLNKALASTAPAPIAETVSSPTPVLYPLSRDPNKCDVCFRTDGTHDPDAPCAVQMG